MTTIERPTTANAFDQACSMEKPLERIRQFTAALARLAITMEDGQAASIVQELTLAIEECLDEVDGSHGFFFHLHHPNRERFEREGWPSEQAAVEAT
jgi:hypothetical protein